MNILTPFIVIVVDMGRRQEQEQLQGLQSEKAYVNFINSLRSKATIKVYRVLIIHTIAGSTLTSGPESYTNIKKSLSEIDLQRLVESSPVLKATN